MKMQSADVEPHAPPLRELDPVAEEVDQDLPQLVFIALDELGEPRSHLR